MPNPEKRQPRRAAKRARRRTLWIWGASLLLAAAALAVVWLLLRGVIAPQRRFGPFDAEDLTINSWQAGAPADSLDVRPLSAREEAGTLLWTLDGALLRLSGDGRLIGASIDGGTWRGPRDLKVGDPQEALQHAFPITDYEEQPEDFALLFAKDLQNGLPVAPYGVLVPSGTWMRVHLAAQPSADWLRARKLDPEPSFALCDIFIDPDNGLIARIEWSLASRDDWLDGMQ